MLALLAARLAAAGQPVPGRLVLAPLPVDLGDEDEHLAVAAEPLNAYPASPGVRHQGSGFLVTGQVPGSQAALGGVR